MFLPYIDVVIDICMHQNHDSHQISIWNFSFIMGYQAPA